MLTICMCLVKCLPLPTGVAVEFEHSVYSVNEYEVESGEICVRLVGNTEVNFTVILSTGEITNLPDNTRANCRKITNVCMNTLCCDLSL